MSNLHTELDQLLYIWQEAQADVRDAHKGNAPEEEIYELSQIAAQAETDYDEACKIEDARIREIISALE